MCGICGIYNFDKDLLVSKKILNDMNQSLAHRGPDDSGFYIDENIGLGHTRLSVIDIDSGSQPMCNEDKTIWITYNGEIYNFKDLRSDLIKKGHTFYTNCDTEVVVHSYEEYGTDCVLKFNGMFSFAVWDKRKDILFLARDRLGIKPLYYYVEDGKFIFASEIKAILSHPTMKKEVNLNSIPQYLFCTTLLNDNTMFKNVFSVPAGHIVVLKNKTKNVKQYWDVRLRDKTNESFNQFKDHTFKLIKESVQMRLMSDVPFGSLLSGGLDSSLISAVANGYVNQDLKTFSIEYEKNSKTNSDSKYARLMASTFKTKHKEFVLSPEEYHNIIKKVIWHVEKPIELTTPSLYLLYRNLKDDITVVLSGEGADELFGGYYFFLNNIQDQLTEFPWAPYLQDVAMLLDPEIDIKTKFRDEIEFTLYKMMNKFDSDDHLNKVLYLFIKFYLLEMLERQDKTSMAWSIEARVPFLDHRLVEYIANIPSKYKVKGDTEKYILKEISKTILPQIIVKRKKKPFPFPVDPKSIYKQKEIANNIVQSKNSRIGKYFNKYAVDDFLNKKNQFQKIDNLAVFRTSYALMALEFWHKVFEV